MNKLFKRITIDPAVCHGKPCVKGSRVMVYQIVDYLANGDTPEDILKAFPELTRDDVRACLAFAAEMTRERVMPVALSG